MTTRTVLLQGQFTDHDLAELAAALRVIERRQPSELFRFFVDGDGSTEEAKAILAKIYPRLEGQVVECCVLERPEGN